MIRMPLPAAICTKPLASTNASNPRHRQAGEDLATATTGMNAATSTIRQTRDGAERARAELAADDRRRKESSVAILEGNEAWASLMTRLPTRVSTAEKAGLLPPEWFVDAVGPRPTPGERADWLEAGALILAYRITYGIEGPRALGLHPARNSDGPDHRTRLYEQAMAMIKNLS